MLTVPEPNAVAVGFGEFTNTIARLRIDLRAAVADDCA